MTALRCKYPGCARAAVGICGMCSEPTCQVHAALHTVGPINPIPKEAA